VGDYEWEYHFRHHSGIALVNALIAARAVGTKDRP
jgi:hypothetical protein